MYGKYGCYGNMLPMVTVGETIQSQQGRSGGLNIAKHNLRDNTINSSSLDL